MLRRLCIFIFYNKQGIVDDYVPYFLSKLKPHITDLVIAVNGDIQKNGLKKLRSFTEYILVRENIGYEPGAIKEVLFKFYGFSKVLEFDELLICNDSFYGPFSDLKKVFHKMDNHKCDFWGITEQGAKEGGHFSYPKHIQSYFYNIKQSLLHSKYFKSFFKNLRLPNNAIEAIKNYEIALSQFFLKTGFSYASYVEPKYFIDNDPNKNFDYSLFAPVNLLKKGCPFVKRKAFYTWPRREQNDLMQFIKDNTKYDAELIRQSLLRVEMIRKIFLFIKNHSELYIYGTGIVAERVVNILKYFDISFKGFIVTHKEKSSFLGHFIYELNEIKINKNTGIILGLNKDNSKEVLRILRKKSINKNCILRVY
jgi:rhamnosyltransferase